VDHPRPSCGRRRAGPRPLPGLVVALPGVHGPSTAGPRGRRRVGCSISKSSAAPEAHRGGRGVRDGRPGARAELVAGLRAGWRLTAYVLLLGGGPISGEASGICWAAGPAQEAAGGALIAEAIGPPSGRPITSWLILVVRAPCSPASPAAFRPASASRCHIPLSLMLIGHRACAASAFTFPQPLRARSRPREGRLRGGRHQPANWGRIFAIASAGDAAAARPLAWAPLGVGARSTRAGGTLAFTANPSWRPWLTTVRRGRRACSHPGPLSRSWPRST